MKSNREHSISKHLYAAIMVALVLGVSVTLPSFAVDDVEPLPVIPEDIALDNDGNAYPEGGPAGLYNAIIDKQAKLGMMVDAEGNVTYEGTNPGHQVALARLRTNLERKLNKDGLLDETPDIEPLPEDIPEVGGLDEEIDPLPTVPVLPEDVALDNEGNAYPEGGPGGLYNAIIDKQTKLGMTVDAEGNVTYEGTNPGHQTALARLRTNLERKLNKDGLLDETPEVPDVPEDPAVEELAISAGLGVSKQSVKAAKVRIEKSQKLDKVAKAEKMTRTERVERPQKPTKITRVEKPQRPEKITRVEKPQRPEKIARVEKPQKPEKIQKPQKPQKPEKPQKPGKP